MPWPSVTYTFSPSTIMKSAEFNQNYTDLVNAIERGMPTGKIDIWPTNTAPAGHLILDGTAISRTTYARLFAVIGTTFGVGDGSTTFNLPDLKGRVAVGRDSGQSEFDGLAETGGAKTHQLTAAEINITGANTWYGTRYCNDYAASGPGIDVAIGHPSGLIGGGGTAHNNLQPYIVLNYIIKD